MYPETTPRTVAYIWNNRNSPYKKELHEAYSSLCNCELIKQGTYPACIRLWVEGGMKSWLFYAEMCDIYFNTVEAYLVEHYPIIAMEAYLLQDVKSE